MKKGLIALSCFALLALSSCGEDGKTTIYETTTVITTTTDKSTTTATTTTTIVTDREDDVFSDGINTLTRKEIKEDLKKNTNDNFYGFDMDSFENKLPMPNTKLEAANYREIIEEISDILDYCAFYHLDEIEIEFKSSFNYESPTFSMDSDYANYFVNQAYWNSKLLVSIVNFTHEYDEASRKMTINFIYNPDANQYITKEDEQYIPTGIPYTFYSTVEKRSENNDTFAYQSYTNGTIDVYNSDQLVYVLENKYIPNCIEGSPAEKVFNKAKNILNNIIYDDMTLLDKETAINSWILSHASYAVSEDYATYSRSSDHPDEIISMLQGAYVEGIFYGNEGVCHGFAKALSLLSSIEGIDNIKVSAPNEAINQAETISSFLEINGLRSYQSHGYVYVKNEEDGLYYINDPTYSFFSRLGNHYAYRNQVIMMAYDEWTYVYADQSKDCFNIFNSSLIAKTSMNYKENFRMKVNGVTMTLEPTTLAEVQALVDNISDYVAAYSDTNYKTGNYLTLNIYPADNIYFAAKDIFYSSNLLMYLIDYASYYPDLGYSIDFLVY